MVKANVMVVEDNGLIALSIQRTLRNLGYAVPAVAASGEECHTTGARSPARSGADGQHAGRRYGWYPFASLPEQW